LVLHVLYLLIGTWLTHRRLLPGLAARWAGVEVGVPLGVSAVVFVAGDLTLRNLGWSTWPTLAAAAVLAALAGGLGLAASPELRSAIRADLLDRRRAAVS